MIHHLKIVDYAISSLLRRKAKNFAIFAAYSFSVTTLASILFLTHALKTEAQFILQGVPDLIVQKLTGGRHDLIPASYGQSIKSIRGVGEIRPRYWGYYYDPVVEVNYTVMGTGGLTGKLDLLTGRLPQSGNECALGVGVAASRGADYSKEIILLDNKNRSRLFEVTGLFEAQSSLLTHDLVVLSDESVINFFDLQKGKATDLAVTVRNSNEIQTIAGKIKKLYPDTRPITKAELVRTYDMVFNWRSGMMLTIFSSAIAALGIVAWDKASGISAGEKQEIGILKAIGWGTQHVLILKFWEGAVISVASFLTGITLAYLHVFYFDATILSVVMKGWSILFPPFELVPRIDLLQLTALFFLTVVPYIVSTVVPTWKSAITDPDTVMRG